MLEEVKIHFPELTNHIIFLYSSASNLFYDTDDTILSTAGLHQGDPLSSLLFSLVLQRVILKVNSTTPDHLANAWFLDDGVLIGSSAGLRSALTTIEEASEACGLVLGHSKCNLHWQSLHSDWSLFPDTIQRNTDGITLLGAPIGSPSYIKAFASKRVEACRQTIHSTFDLQDPQSELILLRACTGVTKIIFLIRTVPPQLIQDELTSFDYHVDEALDHILGSPVANDNRKLWSLPFSMGGFGIPRALDLCYSAFTGSVLGTWTSQQSLGCTSPQLNTLLSFHYFSSFDSFYSLPDNATLLSTQLTQKILKMLIDTHTLNSLITNSTTRIRAILLTRSAPHSYDWLHALPASWNGKTINPSSFRSILQYQSGIPFNRLPKICSMCNQQQDIYGDHAVSGCNKSNHRIYRHNSIIESLVKILQPAGIHTHRETRSSNHHPTRTR